MIKLKT